VRDDFLKPKFELASLSELKALLADDILRTKTSLDKWVLKSNGEFTQDLLRRFYVSRFEPRVAESCVERILLLSNKIDFLELIAGVDKLPWPRAAAVFFDFANTLIANGYKTEYRSLIKAYCAAVRDVALRASPVKSFESFYIDLYAPGTALTQRAIRENLSVWENSGYWAISAPYSKEILARTKALSLLVNKRSHEKIITDLLRKNTQWMSLSEIHKNCALGLSKRQLLRILQKIPHIRFSGELKGRRYSLR
jgi:hypothetical protein